MGLPETDSPTHRKGRASARIHINLRKGYILMTKTKKKILAVVIGVVILALGIGIGATAASNYGTQTDPLVAKSYLDNTLTPKLQQQFQTELDSKVQSMEQKISSLGGGYAAVTIAAGQKLSCAPGCEIIITAGTATATGSSGLSDITAGSAVSNGGGVPVYHLCVVLAQDEGVAASETVQAMVRGSYTLS